MASPKPPLGGVTHPRRPPAERSVSLRHSAPKSRLAQHSRLANDHGSSSSSSNDGVAAAHPCKDAAQPTDLDATHSPSSLNPLGAQTSSGESSSADKWFEKSNNEVRGDHHTSLTDNDPPFFMRHSSSSETPPDVAQRQQQERRQLNFLEANESTQSLPLRTGLLQLGTDASSTDDFRGVIDDLTVKNKKLRRRLKKYERLHDSHLKDDKLFEVRFHGLPPAKKRELEDTLRKFAASLHTSGANAFPPDGYANLVPMLQNHKGTSSHASLPNADSAYASMSASHPGSSGQSGQDAQAKLTPNYLASRRQNIHSYLHDIPEGLMPHSNPTALSERAKKRLVVRRLEGIFAGKDAAKSGHQQPLQQQEVSQSAARADRSAIEATGQSIRQEGAREAHIMQQLAAERRSKKVSAGGNGSPSTTAASNDRSAQKALEQRPTRPLDLDPQRAQVPVENIRYMRHLGFSPLDPDAGNALEDGHGWIYLNFLINMAQLHTINVTPDFVRKALVEYSSPFELSSDGRKVRWRGGESMTHSSSGGETSSHGVSDHTPDGNTPRKRPKLSHNNSHSTTAYPGRSGKGTASTEVNKFAYTPLFFHRDSTDDAADSSSDTDEDETESSPEQAPMGGDSSMMTSSGMLTSSGQRIASAPVPKKIKGDNGPIIFYNNANFCTDLSGDGRVHAGHDQATYTTATEQAIGQKHVPAHEMFDKRGPLVDAILLPEPMNLSDNPIPESMELSFPQQSPLSSEGKGCRAEKPIELEVTGIGGVWPADNFAISVQSRHARVDDQHAPETAHHTAPRSLPPKFAHLLHGSPPRPLARTAMHKQRILASDHKILAPSPLPPAIQFMPFGDEEMEDDESSDAEEAMSLSPDVPNAMPPYTAPQPVDFASHASDEEEDSQDGESDSADDSDSSSDGSVDLLAAARQVDPEAIRAQEREYDANMADRLADEIPAGSSAATAGGGSGFASPGSGVTREEYVRARKEARAAAAIAAAGAGSQSAAGAGLHRTGTSDSLCVQSGRTEQRDGESSGEDEKMSGV